LKWVKTNPWTVNRRVRRHAQAILLALWADMSENACVGPASGEAQTKGQAEREARSFTQSTLHAATMTQS
jgi:hypothetical protein